MNDIEKAKREHTFEDLGANHTTKTTYSTLKAHKSNDQPEQSSVCVDTLNDNFAEFDQFLSVC